MKKFLSVAAAAFMLFAFAACNGTGEDAIIQRPETTPNGAYKYLKTTDKVIDVVSHPAFGGFGKFLLPFNRIYGEDMPLTRAGRLMPYHSNVDPASVVETFNYLIDEVAAGRRVFYDIYSDAEKTAVSAKRNTGIFFFRGNPHAPFAVICAGGGWVYVGSAHESFPHAIELAKKGYNAFAIQYRTGSGTYACEDLAAALSFIFENAAALQVDTEGYSVWGGSAGARMAATIGSWGAAVFGGEDVPKPATVVMQYTGHSEYNPEGEPPTFVTVGRNDGIASYRTMERRVEALRAMGTPVEYHLYENLGHGFGLGVGTSAEGWLDWAVAFWEKNR